MKQFDWNVEKDRFLIKNRGTLSVKEPDLTEDEEDLLHALESGEYESVFSDARKEEIKATDAYTSNLLCVSDKCFACE